MPRRPRNQSPVVVRPRHPSAIVRKRTTKDGTVRWQGIVQYPDRAQPGVWRHQAKTFERKADAQEWADGQVAEHRKAGYQPPKKQTVSEWLDHWMRTYVRVHLRPSTAETYQWLIRIHISPALGSLFLAELSPQLLQAWVADLSQKPTKRGTPLSPRTVAAVRGVLQDALAEAVRLGVVPVNPLDRVRPPKQQPKVVQSFTLAQVRALDAACTHRRLGPLLTLLWQTGLRIGEAIALRWEDVDLDGASIYVHRKITEVGGQRIEGAPKTAAGTREIALAPQTVELLRRHREQQAFEELLHGGEPSWNAEGLVFPSTKGTPLGRRNVTRVWEEVRDAAGLPKYGLHALRHTNASLQLQAGVGIREIAATLGHENPGFTARIYAHVLERTKRRAAEQFGELLKDDE